MFFRLFLLFVLVQVSSVNWNISFNPITASAESDTFFQVDAQAAPQYFRMIIGSLICSSESAEDKEFLEFRLNNRQSLDRDYCLLPS
ncbi:hypothetical protein CHH80_11580 [Bacillus sp. 7504-2]|nr:hypothetical protein CHH80_11580 [Bacillus sp. 7504-2]